jgi:hypothetical protein
MIMIYRHILVVIYSYFTVVKIAKIAAFLRPDLLNSIARNTPAVVILDYAQNRCGRHSSPWERSPQYNCALSTAIMVRVATSQRNTAD